MVLLGIYPFALGAVAGSPFRYANDTFPVCAPDKLYLHDDDCEKPAAGFAYHVGQLVPMLVQKCYVNYFDPQVVIAYTIHRRLVSDQNGLSISMGDTFATAHKGCETLRQAIHAVPLETPSGVYHFEGFSEIHAWRLENVPWRSATFPVSSVPEGGT